LRAIKESPPPNDIEFRSGFIETAVRRQTLRDSFAKAIANIQSPEAQQFTKRLAKRKYFVWLHDVALVAKHRHLEASWLPPRLDSIVQLKAGSRKKVLTTSRDLMDTVVEVLEDIRPAFESQEIYWKDPQNGVPADEVAITKNLAEWLRLKLTRCVLNAEVSCRSGRTDIQIEAIVENGASDLQPLKCILEAKKCNNPDLSTAIENQLSSKYLLPGDAGLYLVLWFTASCTCQHCYNKLLVIDNLTTQAEKSHYPISVVHFHMRNPSQKSRRRSVNKKVEHDAL